MSHTLYMTFTENIIKNHMPLRVYSHKSFGMSSIFFVMTFRNVEKK